VRAQAPETVVLLRTATAEGTYHFAEAIHQRGKLVVLDVGYIDFDDPKLYRELWIGSGVTPFAGSKGFLTVEGLLTKAFGAQANGALFLQPYLLGIYRMAPRVPFEASYLGYVPLNNNSRAQHLLERAKLEYDFSRFKVGGGYSAYKFGDLAWNHKPFITATLKAGTAGNFEVWLQRVPVDGNSELAVQLRYAKAFVH
jgi:hypothetical protein